MLRFNPKRCFANRGVAAIEFAIVLPILLLFTFGMIDFGRAMWTQGTLTYAAQATARCMAIHSDRCSDPVAYGRSQAYGLTGPGITVTATSPDPVCGKEYTLSMHFTYFMPLLSHFSGTFSATACYPAS